MALRRRAIAEIPPQGWLVRDDRVLCSFEAPPGRRGRARGLLGRTGVTGVMVLPTRSIHTVGMKFDLDVAFIDDDGTVIRALQLRRNRVTVPVWSARWVIEAEPGCFTRWNLSVGDVLEFRPAGECGGPQ